MLARIAIKNLFVEKCTQDTVLIDWILFILQSKNLFDFLHIDRGDHIHGAYG